MNAAKRANVAFYPIDARGFGGHRTAGDASSASGRGQSAFTGTNGRAAEPAAITLRKRFRRWPPTRAGGFCDGNGSSLGMQKARDDIASCYILGYYSTNGKMDGNTAACR